MIKKYLLTLAILPVLGYAQAPAGYYSGTEGLSGYALKSKLHDIISKNYNWHYDDLKTLYGQTDIDKYYDYDASNTTYLLDIYSNNPTGTTAYHYTLSNIISSANAEGLGWNREHMMPQSSFNSAYPMYSDLFFVVPTDARINQLRSNFPYGKAGSTVYYNFTNGSKQASNGTPGAIYTGRVYEPIDEFKGDVARSLLYFVVRYEGKLGGFNYSTNADPTKDQNPLNGTEEKAYDDWYIAMLLNWHQQDPVSAREITRNNSVYNIQKNRNPFIDHPEWVNLIWNQTPDNIPPSTPSQLSMERNSAYFVNLKWQASPESDVLGYRIYQDNVLIGTSKTSSFSADHLTPNTTYNFTVKAYDTSYLESAQSNTMNVTTLESDIFAKDLQIVKYLEGTGNNKAFEIANRTGHKVNLNGYKLYIQYKGTVYYFGEPFELEGEIENNQSFVAINPNANFSCFNNLNAKFVTAAPSLTFTGGQYVDLSYKSSTVDAVGVKGQDNANGNKSLYRKPEITNPTATFDINEWTSYASDYCQGLGVLGINDITDRTFDFNIYPNPVVHQLYVNGEISKAKSAKIYDLSGKLIKEINNPFVNQKSIDVQSLLPNTYILNIDGKSVKFIKK
ncbi:endonuclease [Epilithonimonas pallida]|uniref:Por secretion system C-terminal sorting domain-containing protein n=1 Tax=Epilithonimonas pallida TaxID=373671 RepID=A0ABY1R2K6_9FLAO|nr:endonuclease [Epilithonimonas pallida]SMP93345.1 Por secretion system C-terminal sorting domain-containing protein [Epilithonimonas pallida]